MLSEGCRLRIFSHGWGMSLSEGAVTSCGILPRTGAFLQSDDFMKQAKFIAEAANMTVAGWEKPVYLSKPTESVFEDVE